MTRPARYLTRKLTRPDTWSEPEPASRRDALRQLARHYYDPESTLRESSEANPARTPWAIFWRIEP